MGQASITRRGGALGCGEIIQEYKKESASTVSYGTDGTRIFAGVFSDEALSGHFVAYVDTIGTMVFNEFNVPVITIGKHAGGTAEHPFSTHVELDGNSVYVVCRALESSMASSYKVHCVFYR